MKKKKVEKKKPAKAKDAKQVAKDAAKFEKELSKARKQAIKWWMKSERPKKLHMTTSGKVRLPKSPLCRRAANSHVCPGHRVR